MEEPWGSTIENTDSHFISLNFWPHTSPSFSSMPGCMIPEPPGFISLEYEVLVSWRWSHGKTREGERK